MLFTWFIIVILWLCTLPYALVLKGDSLTKTLAVLIPITMCTIVVQVVIVIKKRIKENKLQKIMVDKGFSQIDNLSPQEFENWVARLMRIQGFKSYATKFSGDYGVDVIAEKDGWKIGIQVKKYTKPVGIKAIQEIASGMVHYGCNEGWVISTTPYFTNAAIKLAKEHGIMLFDKENLALYYLNAKNNHKKKNNKKNNMA